LKLTSFSPAVKKPLSEGLITVIQGDPSLLNVKNSAKAINATMLASDVEKKVTSSEIVKPRPPPGLPQAIVLRIIRST
jgi:hypothetical protein